MFKEISVMSKSRDILCALAWNYPFFRHKDLFKSVFSGLPCHQHFTQKQNVAMVTNSFERIPLIMSQQKFGQ